MRISFGSVRVGNPDYDMFGYGIAVVRGGYSVVHQSCEFTESRVRMCRTGREATILGRTRATGHSHSNLPHHWIVRIPDAGAEIHSYASVVRRVLVHGRRVTQGAAVLRPNTDHVYAEQVPARLHVLETGMFVLLFIACRVNITFIV